MAGQMIRPSERYAKADEIRNHCQDGSSPPAHEGGAGTRPGSSTYRVGSCTALENLGMTSRVNSSIDEVICSWVKVPNCTGKIS